MQRIITVLLLLGAVAAISCSSPQAEIVGDSPDPAKPNILIAFFKGAQTQHKADLVQLLRADFGARYNLIVRVVAAPADLKDEDYRALIVMDNVKGNLRFNKGLKQFPELPDQAKTVYFLSAGDANWKWKARPDLRVVTGATAQRKAAQTYPALKAQLEAIL